MRCFALIEAERSRSSFRKFGQTVLILARFASEIYKLS